MIFWSRMQKERYLKKYVPDVSVLHKIMLYSYVSFVLFFQVLLHSSSSKLRVANDIQLLEVHSIDEEKLNVGIGDTVQVKFGTEENSTISLRVDKILSISSCLLSYPATKKVSFHMSEILRAIRTSSRVTLQKSVRQICIHHQSFLKQLQRPSFSVCNGCLPPKQDYALSMVLLSMLQTTEIMRDGIFTQEIGNFDSIDRQELVSMSKTLLIEDLKLRGVANPSLPIKKGGKIGQEWIDYVYARYLRSFSSPCPATVSVIGSMMAQEAIKSITHMYHPISQMFCFESLDSLHKNAESKTTNDESFGSFSLPTKESCGPIEAVYGQEMQNTLRSLRVFVVGSGAIGCELLKNFALLGIGTGSSNSSINSQLPPTLWSEFGLQQGGIFVTDMDLIEKSNLNRQLLFR